MNTNFCYTNQARSGAICWCKLGFVTVLELLLSSFETAQGQEIFAETAFSTTMTKMKKKYTVEKLRSWTFHLSKQEEIARSSMMNYFWHLFFVCDMSVTLHVPNLERWDFWQNFIIRTCFYVSWWHSNTQKGMHASLQSCIQCTPKSLWYPLLEVMPRGRLGRL